MTAIVAALWTSSAQLELLKREVGALSAPSGCHDLGGSRLSRWQLTLACLFPACLRNLHVQLADLLRLVNNGQAMFAGNASKLLEELDA
jgi:hypothetical protein